MNEKNLNITQVVKNNFNEMYEATLNNGGYSVNALGLKPISGYMISTTEIDNSKMYNFSKEFLLNTMSGFKTMILNSSLDYYLGLWYNSDDSCIYADISENVDNLLDAKSLAVENEQTSIYDVKFDCCINTDDIPIVFYQKFTLNEFIEFYNKYYNLFSYTYLKEAEEILSAGALNNWHLRNEKEIVVINDRDCRWLQFTF